MTEFSEEHNAIVSMEEVDEADKAVVPMVEVDQVEKAVVIKRKEVPQVPQEFIVGDNVKLSLILGGHRTTSKQMKVVEAVPRAGKWWYKVRQSGESQMYRDGSGQELFQEENLSFW